MDPKNNSVGVIVLVLVILLVVVGGVLWLRGLFDEYQTRKSIPARERAFQQAEQAFGFFLQAIPLQIRDRMMSEASNLESSSPDLSKLLRALGDVMTATSPNALVEEWRQTLEELRRQIPVYRAFWPRLGGAMFALGFGVILGILTANPDLFQLLWHDMLTLAQRIASLV